MAKWGEERRERCHSARSYGALRTRSEAGWRNLSGIHRSRRLRRWLGLGPELVLELVLLSAARGALLLDIRASLRYQLSVPVIARFYGITVKMYFREHGVPHFHAVYGEFNGVFEVSTLKMIEGDLPVRAQRLVRDWAERYRDEMARMWQTQEYRLLPGLD